MKKNFSLPLAACLTETGDTDNIEPAACTSRCNLIIAETRHINHILLEETDDDDELAQRYSAALSAAKSKAADGALIAAVLGSEDCAVEYDCGAFEAAVFDYLEKMTILRDLGTDIILMHGCSRLWQMRAAVIAGEQAEIPVFVTVNADEDGKSENETDYISALITLQSLGAAAFGIYSTDGAGELSILLEKALPHAEIPLIAVEDMNSLDDAALKRLSYSGASIYLNTAPDPDGETAKKLLSLTSVFDPDTEKDSYAAAVESEVFFLSDNIELSEPIECDWGMSYDLIDMDDENINSVCIVLNSSDDVSLLAVNSDMSRLPLTVHTNDSNTLEAALRYFTGRLIVDSRCAIERSELDALCEKYGAIVY